ncbi:MAG: chemotaxis protein CheB [bacterium]
MIDVLVVDDSTLVRDLINHILKSDNEINVIGSARNGKEAIEFVSKQKPHVITLDINMPVMDGIETTKKIMDKYPLPILILSTFWNNKEVIDSFKALMEGAITIVEKPVGANSPRFMEISDNLIHSIKTIAGFKFTNDLIPDKHNQLLNSSVNLNSCSEIKIIGIGATFSGMVLIKKILSSLNKRFCLPVVIVQQMNPGFIEGFAEWLNETSNIPVKIASHGEKIKNGTCYLAPDFHHLTVSPEGKIYLLDEAPVSGLRPSLTYFFDSLSESFGTQSSGILVTGACEEGIAEFKKLHDIGAVTMALVKDKAIFFQLPGEEIIPTFEQNILSSDEVITFLNRIAV